MSEVNRYTFKGAAGEYVYANDFDRVTAERDGLQVSLNTADQTIDDLNAAVSRRTHRVRELEAQLAYAVDALNEVVKVSAMHEKPFEIATLAIGEMSALKPAEGAPCCAVSVEDQALLDAGDYTPEELFGIGGKPSCPKCANP